MMWGGGKPVVDSVGRLSVGVGRDQTLRSWRGTSTIKWARHHEGGHKPPGLSA